MPAGGNHFVQHVRGDLDHGDDADGDGGNGQDAELDDLGKHHAEHAALDNVERRDAHQDPRIGVIREMPRQELAGELADAFGRVGQEPDHTHQRKHHHDDVRRRGAGVFAEPGLDPFRPGHHVRTPQPDGHIDHQKNLVEGRPKPRQPGPFHSIRGRHINQPHGSGDIEHARRIRNAQHVPGQLVATQEIVTSCSLDARLETQKPTKIVAIRYRTMMLRSIQWSCIELTDNGFADAYRQSFFCLAPPRRNTENHIPPGLNRGTN